MVGGSIEEATLGLVGGMSGGGNLGQMKYHRNIAL